MDKLYQSINSYKKLIEAQERRINYLSEKTRSLQVQESIEESSSIHNQVLCDGCLKYPLQGVRYKCKICLDYDLCKQCRNSVPHEHDEFYKLYGDTCHLKKNCVECGEKNIRGVAFRCKTCLNYTCYKCKNLHPHMDIVEILPFVLEVETKYNDAEMLVGREIAIYFILCNKGNQVIESIQIRCLTGQAPFTVPRNVIDVNLQKDKILVLPFKTRLFDRPGNYEFTLQFFETNYEEMIGNKINLKLEVEYPGKSFLSHFL